MHVVASTPPPKPKPTAETTTTTTTTTQPKVVINTAPVPAPIAPPQPSYYPMPYPSYTDPNQGYNYNYDPSWYYNSYAPGMSYDYSSYYNQPSYSQKYCFSDSFPWSFDSSLVMPRIRLTTLRHRWWVMLRCCHINDSKLSIPLRQFHPILSSRKKSGRIVTDPSQLRQPS